MTWELVRKEIDEGIGNPPVDSGWTKRGSDAQDFMSGLCEKYSAHMDLVPIDDSYHSTSLMVFLHREDDDGHHSSYVGSDVWIIPQSSGEPPMRIFLSPDSSSSLMKAMSSIFDIMSSSLY